MSEQIKDGGAAFPIPNAEHASSHQWAEYGMTLRDYFAAKVLGGMAAALSVEDVANLADGYKGGTLNAKAAYVLADSMLAAREARP